MATPTVGIICVKEHEYNVFLERIRLLVSQGILKPSCPERSQAFGNNTVKKSFFSFDSRFNLIVATFGDKQGPVVAATRCTQFIGEANLTHIGMVGICGGRKLGSVIVGTRATDKVAGRKIWSVERNEFQFVEAPDATESPTIVPVPLEILRWGKHFDVHYGEFASYPYVNDDLSWLSETQGLEMEAHAMFHAVRVAHPSMSLLPVIKGVSDVAFIDRTVGGSGLSAYNLTQLSSCLPDTTGLLPLQSFLPKNFICETHSQIAL